MKSTQRKDAIRNILKKKVSFLSIVLIVMLGVGGFFATSFMVKGLENKGEAFYDKYHFKDFEIDSTEGLTREDIRTIGDTEGVEAVEGVQSVDAGLRRGELRKSINLLSLTKKVSTPEVLKGRLPKKSNECMIAEDLAVETGIGIGNKVRIQISDSALREGFLRAESFTVTGLMHHPDYLRKGIGAPVVVPLKAFDRKKTEGKFSSAFVRINKPTNSSMFSEDYFKKTEDIRQRLETAAGEIRVSSSLDTQDEVEEKLEEGRKKIRDGEKELDEKLQDAQKKLQDAEAELERKKDRGEEELRQGEQRLAKAQEDLKKAKKDIAKGEKKLKKAKKKLKSALKELNGLTPEQMITIIEDIAIAINAMKEAIESGDETQIATVSHYVEEFLKVPEVRTALTVLGKRLDLDPAEIEEHIRTGTLIDEFRTELEEYAIELKTMQAAPAQIKKGKKKLARMKQKLKAGEQDYNKGLEDLEKGRRELASGLREGRSRISDGWNQYYREKEKAEKKLQNARNKYQKQEKKAQKIIRKSQKKERASEGYVVVRDRLSNGGYVDFRSNIRSVRSSGQVFGIGFLILCAMVCFSTLALIIEEQKHLVGTAKAFGLYPGEILKKYLIFGVTAAFAGSLLGIPMAVALGNYALFMIERNRLYFITGVKSVVTVIPAAAVVLLAMCLCATVTVIACSSMLKTPASRLMKGEILKRSREKAHAAKAVKRRKRPAARGRLYSRLIVRNMRGDLARVILTIAIISGSCFIIGLGFTVRESLTGMIEAQEQEIHRYDCRADLGSGVTDKQKAQIRNYLDREGIHWTSGTYETHLYRTDGRTEALTVLSAVPEHIEEIYALRDPKTQERIELPGRGILIQNRLHETAGFSEGDTMKLYGLDLSPRKAEVAGQFQNYEGRLIIMSEEAYRDIFRKEPTNNSIFLHFDGDEKQKITAGLGAISEDITFEDSDAFSERFRSIIGIFNVVVAMMIGIAVLMSFMILMNLTNIFVSRKKKEIITMRVNGFSRRETDGYLIRETVFMTVTGLAIAFIAGMLTTEPFVRLLEQPDVQSIRTPSPVLWGIGVLIEALFAAVISYIAFRQTRKYHLREIAES